MDEGNNFKRGKHYRKEKESNRKTKENECQRKMINGGEGDDAKEELQELLVEYQDM